MGTIVCLLQWALEPEKLRPEQKRFSFRYQKGLCCEIIASQLYLRKDDFIKGCAFLCDVFTWIHFCSGLGERLDMIQELAKCFSEQLYNSHPPHRNPKRNTLSVMCAKQSCPYHGVVVILANLMCPEKMPCEDTHIIIQGVSPQEKP